MLSLSEYRFDELSDLIFLSFSYALKHDNTWVERASKPNTLEFSNMVNSSIFRFNKLLDLTSLGLICTMNSRIYKSSVMLNLKKLVMLHVRAKYIWRGHVAKLIPLSLTMF